MNPCFFTAPSPLHMVALSAWLVLAIPTATHFFGVQTLLNPSSCRPSVCDQQAFEPLSEHYQRARHSLP
jgi:hypothetical protein